MGRIKWLFTEGVTDLNSYNLGVIAERERIIELLEEWGEVAGCYCCALDAAAADIIECIEGKKNVNEL